MSLFAYLIDYQHEIQIYQISMVLEGGYAAYFLLSESKMVTEGGNPNVFGSTGIVSYGFSKTRRPFPSKLF